MRVLYFILFIAIGSGCEQVDRHDAVVKTFSPECHGDFRRVCRLEKFCYYQADRMAVGIDCRHFEFYKNKYKKEMR